MRLLELDLRAYGPFANERIDLSHGNRGVHLIFGRNEAGKSTALRGLITALYGYHPRTTDCFRFVYPALRVGASLRGEDGAPFRFLRRKGRTGTLIDPDDERIVLDDAKLAGLLHGCDQQTFEQVFGLDQKRLRGGGEGLASGTGKLGETLFGAGTDLTRLRALSKRLDDDARKLFRATGENPAINKDLEAYDAARKARATEILTGGDWNQAVQRLQECQDRERRFSEQWIEKKGEANRLHRLQTTAADLTRRSTLQGVIQDASELPRVRPSFCSEYDEVQGLIRERRPHFQYLKTRCDEENKALDRLAVDELWLRHQAEIDELLAEWASARKEIQALESLRAALDSDLRAVELSRQRLGLPADDETQRQSQPVRSRIQKLAAEHARLDSSLGTVLEGRQKLLSEHSRAKRLLDELGAPIIDGLLGAVLVDAESQVLNHQKHSEAAATLAEKRRTIQNQIPQLLPWRGEAESLEALPVPSEASIQKYEADLEAIHQEAHDTDLRLRQVELELTECTTGLVELEESGDVPTESDLTAAREEREAAWERLGLKPPVAPVPAAADVSAYEGAVLRADNVVDRLRREAKRVAEKVRLRGKRQKLDTERGRLCARADVVADQRERLQADWSRLWEPAGWCPATSHEARTWLGRLIELRRLFGEAAKLEHELAVLETGISTASMGLKSALLERLPDEAAGLDRLPFPALLARGRELAQTDARRNESIRKQKDAVDAAVDVLRARDVEIGEKRRELDDWKSRWVSAVQSLGSHAADVDPARVDEVIELYRQYDDARDRSQESSERFARAEELRTRLAAESDRLRAGLGLERSDLGMAVDLDELKNRLAHVRGVEAERERVKEGLKKTEAELEDERGKLEEAQSRLDALAREAGCGVDGLASLVERLKELHATESELRTVEQRLGTASDGLTLEALVQEHADDPADTRGARLEVLRREIDELETQVKEHNQQVGEARKAREHLEQQARLARGCDTAVEMELLVSRINRQAEEYTELRLASAVLASAIEAYRKQNQSAVLERAGELFRRFTLGSFAGLDAVYEDEAEPRLVARRGANQPDVPIGGMSEGTVDQLYLALKLASLEERVRTGTVLPVVLDDILVNFDNERSAATFEYLAELSHQTQVLYFTHHEHLVELAESRLSHADLFVAKLGNGGR